MSDRPTILAELSDTSMTLRYDGRQMLVIAVRPDQSGLQIVAPAFDDIDWVDSLDDPPSLRIAGRRVGPTPQLEQPQPQPQPEVRLPATPSAPPSVVMARRLVKNSSALTEAERDEILQEVLDSWVRHPNQSKIFTAQESHRIATQVFGDDTHHNVMRVAGVRAALSRGVYDYSLTELVERRRRERLARSFSA